MKLDYVADASIIRLFDFTPAEAGQLLASVADLASGNAERIEVQLLQFVDSIDGCQLVLVSRSWDQAVVRKSGSAKFECGLTAGTWDNVAALVEPLAEGASGFQWLATVPGEAALLLSADGHW